MNLKIQNGPALLGFGIQTWRRWRQVKTWRCSRRTYSSTPTGRMANASKHLDRCAHETFDNLLAAQQRVLAGEFPELIRFGGEAAERIWIQRNVRLHPTVQLTEPVYIAPNCQVDAGARIGPNVVLSEGCMVDRHLCSAQLDHFAAKLSG